jgi:hypothetical protein
LDNTSNNTTAGAATIPFNTNVTGQIEASNDVDHYKFVITTGGSITLTLTTLPANYHLRLVNSAGTVLVTSSKSGTTNESITYTAAAGTYYARVYGATSSTFNATSCYTLRVNLGTATRNETVTSVNQDGSGVVVAYPNPFKNKLNITLTGYNGSTEVGIYSISGLLLKSARTGDGVLQMDLTDLPKGLYLMKVMNSEKQTVISKIVKQ